MSKATVARNERLPLWLALVAIAATLAACGLRRTAVFQDRVELPLYDQLTLALAPWAAGHADIALATIRDPSAWPWTDERLADFLETVLRAEPSCIVVDLIRDTHVPHDPPSRGAERLRRLAREDGRIVWARGVPGSEGDFPPPAALDDLGDDELRMRVGLAGFPVDGDGMIRRGLLAIDDGAWFSLPYHAAFRHRVAAGADPDAVVEVMMTLANVDPRTGGYVKNVGGGNQFLLKPVRGIDSLFPDHPAEPFASGNDAPQAGTLQGKIVLLGTHDASLAQDEKQVPGNPDLRGVKLLAATTAQLLRELEGTEEPVRWLPDLFEDLFLLACALVTVLVGWKLPLQAFLGTVISAATGAAVAVGTAAILMTQGIWLPGGAPMFAAGLSAAGTQALLLAFEHARGNSLYALLEKNLGPQVAERLWRHNEALMAGRNAPPETFQGTAFFADLKGYTAATEHFGRAGDSDGFLRWLNAYLESCVPAVTRCGGFVQDFAGDGIFVVFGFPASADHAAQALECAAGIARRVAELNSARPQGDPAYCARVGIYTGEILCATVGNSAQMKLSFLGSTTNKAARLESMRKDEHDTVREPVRVLFSDPTHAAAGAALPCRKFHPEPILIDPNLPAEIVWKLEIYPQESNPEASI